jgi:hypothetical protein
MRICASCVDILTLHNDRRVAQETEVRGTVVCYRPLVKLRLSTSFVMSRGTCAGASPDSRVCAPDPSRCSG